VDFDYSGKVHDLRARLTCFMEENVYPAESAFAAEVLANRRSGNAWIPTQVMESLKAKARAAGLWNLFLPESDLGAGLTNLEYAPLCEIMGRSWIAPEAFNCNAPDTGNMEVLVRYATPAQKKQWLEPCSQAIRSAFAMTEPDVASSTQTSKHRSTATATLRHQRPKWWTTGRPDPPAKS
jgi:acyl-CoA dehydrogenase